MFGNDGLALRKRDTFEELFHKSDDFDMFGEE
jgi:hypothetical protein